MENDKNYWIFCTNENSEKSWRTFKNWAIAPWRPGDPSKITSTHSRNGFVTPTIVDLSICHQFLHCIEVQLCQAQSSIYHLHLEFPIICIIIIFMSSRRLIISSWSSQGLPWNLPKLFGAFTTLLWISSGPSYTKGELRTVGVSPWSHQSVSLFVFIQIIGVAP